MALAAVLGLSLAFSLHATRPEMLKMVSKIGYTFKHHAIAFEIAGGTIFGGVLLTATIYKIQACRKAAKRENDDAYRNDLYKGSGDEDNVGNLSESSFPTQPKCRIYFLDSKGKEMIFYCTSLKSHDIAPLAMTSKGSLSGLASA